METQTTEGWIFGILSAPFSDGGNTVGNDLAEKLRRSARILSDHVDTVQDRWSEALRDRDTAQEEVLKLSSKIVTLAGSLAILAGMVSDNAKEEN